MTDENLFTRLTPGAVYTEDEKKVRDWVYKNREMFIRSGWTAWEVASLALKIEVADVIAVYSILSHFQDALAGTHIENRQAMNELQFDLAIEDANRLKDKLARQPELDLGPQWQAVKHYQVEGHDWDIIE